MNCHEHHNRYHRVALAQFYGSVLFLNSGTVIMISKYAGSGRQTGTVIIVSKCAVRPCCNQTFARECIYVYESAYNRGTYYRVTRLQQYPSISVHPKIFAQNKCTNTTPTTVPQKWSKWNDGMSFTLIVQPIFFAS